MKKLSLIILLVIQGCGTERDGGPPMPVPAIRVLGLTTVPDTSVESLQDAPQCLEACSLIHVGGEPYFCYRPHEEWRKLSEYLDEGQLLYCK